MSDPLVAVVLFGVPALLGIRATYRLWRIYLFDAVSRDQLILLAFALIATAITVASIYSGMLALRRLLGFDPLPWTPIASLVIAGIILLIPAALERLVDYIGRSPGEV